ncbi:MAG: hypothetical protein EA395_09785 [Phormidium sp. GEM2.Bin31]|nr:MAG: hypothetical protein EA395_09785 [Phormidium sp. GEM2.Bin31]
MGEKARGKRQGARGEPRRGTPLWLPEVTEEDEGGEVRLKKMRSLDVWLRAARTGAAEPSLSKLIMLRVNLNI